MTILEFEMRVYKCFSVVELDRVSLGSSSTSDIMADGNHNGSFCLRKLFTQALKRHDVNSCAWGVRMADQRRELTAPAVAWQPRTIYLTAYNILFASLWAWVFVRAMSGAPRGRIWLFHATEAYARWIQTAALIEVLHAAFGMFIIVTSSLTCC